MNDPIQVPRELLERLIQNSLMAKEDHLANDRECLLIDSDLRAVEALLRQHALTTLSEVSERLEVTAQHPDPHNPSMTTTLFQQLGLRALPESATTPEPTVIVTDVDFIRDTITGELRIDGYTVTVSQSFKTDRMGLYEFNQRLSDQAEEIAQAQARKQSRP